MTETAAPDHGERTPLLRSMGRGFLGRCPHCGEGRIFGKFLKVRPHCDVCDLELAHHRADDLPPYIVIFIIGHIVGYFLLETETNYDVPLWFQLTFWPIVTLIGSLALLQPVKGAVVGLQYALGMHGFAKLPVPGAATGPQGEEKPHGPGDGHAANRAAGFGPA
ncbi:DUF983 domain-containing protein [Methylobacterium sp. M6A4_1b]